MPLQQRQRTMFLQYRQRQHSAPRIFRSAVTSL